jgi:hypothetical protein
MSESRPVSLSKSRVLAGYLCPKRLYLQLHALELAAAPDTTRRHRFAQGHEVGRVAQRAFPGGVAASTGGDRLDDAVARTAALLRDPTVPAIFEATFRHDDLLARVDVLARARAGARWRLIEVKSTTGVKLHHPIDVAIQRHVVEGCGVAVEGTDLMHLNSDYVYPGGEPDARALFTLRDITEEVCALDGVVRDLCPALRRMLAAEAPPDVPTGRQCKKPWVCDFFDHCNRPPVLPQFVSGIAGAVLGPELPEALTRLAYPLYGMDFETLGPPIPRFPGMRPYQAIPFQWSVDVVRAPGAPPEHREFLALHEADPRRAFLQSLAEAVGDEGPIVVYSSYESTRLAELAAALPDLAPVAERIRARLWDFLPVMRRHVAHPAFGGSFSLKRVLPALAPGLGYEDLEINDGSLAGIFWERLVRERPPREEAARIEEALRAYCRRDTEGLLTIVRTLAR